MCVCGRSYVAMIAAWCRGVCVHRWCMARCSTSFRAAHIGFERTYVCHVRTPSWNAMPLRWRATRDPTEGDSSCNQFSETWTKAFNHIYWPRNEPSHVEGTQIREITIGSQHVDRSSNGNVVLERRVYPEKASANTRKKLRSWLRYGSHWSPCRN